MKKIGQVLRANSLFLRLIWRESRSYYFFYGFVIVMQAALSLIWVMVPQWFLGSILNDKDWKGAVGIIGAVTLAQIVWIFTERLISRRQERTLYVVAQTMKQKIIEKACADSLLAYEDHDYYERMNRAMAYTDQAGDSILRLAGNIVTQVISLVGVSYIVGRVDTLILLCYLILIVTTYVFHRLENKEWFRFQNNERLQKVRFLNVLSRLFFQKDFVAEMKLSPDGAEFINRYVRKQSMDFYDFQVRKERKRYRFGFPAQAMAHVQQFVSYAYFGWLLLRGAIDVAAYSTLFAAITQFTNSLSSILDYSVEFQNQADEAQFFIEFLKDKTYALQGKVPVLGFRTVEFRDVSFRYPGQTCDALRHVSFTLKFGEKIAIVGENGSGKTTLVKLLMGLYPPTCGQILVDGKPLNTLQMESWQKGISCVFQNSVHIPLRVEQDVALSDTIQTDRLNDALKQTGMWERIMRLPQKAASFMTREFDDTGVDFSGGEKQRLAIARAYYKGSDLLVMDEPSSALDADTEYALFQQIHAIGKNKTVVFISHRMSSVLSADRILLLDRGQIEESGTHEQLMRHNGVYAKMFHKQAEYYRT